MNDLYNTNNIFYNLIVDDNYTTVYITEPIHKDRKAKFQHFTAYLCSDITDQTFNKYHFYVNTHNTIVSMTQIQNII